MDQQRSSTLRIACYGFADPRAGSVSTACYLVLRQLLLRGHHVDFFNKSSFVRPRDLESLPNYRFVDVPTPTFDRMVEGCGRWCHSIPRHLLSQVAHRAFASKIIGAMRRHHARQPYDIQLWLGDWSWGRIGDIPVVSWVQGPPETDARSIARHKEQIIRLCGKRAYFPLRLYAAYRGTLGLPRFDFTDMFIVGSAWSRRCLATYGISPGLIHSLAYPIDLHQFVPAPDAHANGGPQTVLYLGRSVPRKRLDLFLDACARLIRAGANVNILVVGDFRFTPGFAKLIDQFPIPERLRYSDHLPREQIIPMLRSAAVVVQPSEDENFGTTIAEALACGTPVVLGPTNGTGDYMGNGGMRFAQYDAPSVADAIGRVLDQNGALRAAAREAAEQSFDTAKITEELIALLDSAIMQRSRKNSFLRDDAAESAQLDPARTEAPTTLSA